MAGGLHTKPMNPGIEEIRISGEDSACLQMDPQIPRLATVTQDDSG